MTTVLRWRVRRPLDLAVLADLAARGKRPSDLVPVAVGGSMRPHVIEIGATAEGAEGTCVTGGERSGFRTVAPPVADGARIGLRSGRLSDVMLSVAGVRRLA